MTSVLNDRLTCVEEAIGTDNVPISKDVYARLKAIEDRLLLLERISPDQQLPATYNEEENYEQNRKQELTESLIDINNEIAQLRNELMLK